MRIAAYKGISWKSSVTRFFNWSDYSHVSAINENDHEIEAWTTGGVRELDRAHSDHTPGTIVEVYEFSLTRAEEDDFWAFLVAQKGKEYDYRGILHFGTRRPERPKDQDRWFCSELIHAASVQIRKPLQARIPSYKVYPGMIVISPRLTFAYERSVPGRRHTGIYGPDPTALHHPGDMEFCCAH